MSRNSYNHPSTKKNNFLLNVNSRKNIYGFDFTCKQWKDMRQTK